MLSESDDLTWQSCQCTYPCHILDATAIVCIRGRPLRMGGQRKFSKWIFPPRSHLSKWIISPEPPSVYCMPLITFFLFCTTRPQMINGQPPRSNPGYYRNSILCVQRTFSRQWLVAWYMYLNNGSGLFTLNKDPSIWWHFIQSLDQLCQEELTVLEILVYHSTPKLLEYHLRLCLLCYGIPP